MQVVSGPAMAVAPGLSRLAETLSTPAFAQLPAQIGTFSDVLGEVSRRLGPLTQFAESAGGLLGGFRIPGSRPAAVTPQTDAAASVVEAEQPPMPAAPAEDLPAKKPAAKKAPAKRKSAAKKAPAKRKSAAKKTPTIKTTTIKTTAKKAPATKKAARAKIG